MTERCPACDGSGYDVIQPNRCFTCGGTGSKPYACPGIPSPDCSEEKPERWEIDVGAGTHASIEDKINEMDEEIRRLRSLVVLLEGRE